MIKKSNILLLLAIVAIASCTSKSNEVDTAVEGDIKPDVVVPEIKKQEERSYKDVSYIISESQYPKTFNAWGYRWIKDINRGMPYAVQYVASNPSCDEPVIADLSEQRSIVREKVVYYVDCKNGERFYIADSDLGDFKREKNLKESQENEEILLNHKHSEYINTCEKAARQKENQEQNVYFDVNAKNIMINEKEEGRVIVTMPFSYNLMGIDTIYKTAECTFNKDGTSSIFVTR